MCDFDPKFARDSDRGDWNLSGREDPLGLKDLWFKTRNTVRRFEVNRKVCKENQSSRGGNPRDQGSVRIQHKLRQMRDDLSGRLLEGDQVAKERDCEEP